MNSFRVFSCVKCDNCIVDNRNHMHDEKNFFIRCDLNIWEGQRSVRISEQFAPIPDECPLIEKEDEDEN